VESPVERAEALRGGQVDPREDNMLLVTTDGRKAALDLRLHNPRLPDHPDSKVNRAVAEVERIWRETGAERSTQLVFCDLSVPTGGQGFSVYEDMRDKLIAKGIPASDIEFVQNHDSDAAKLQLFRDVRAGKVRILFGSTQKMGTGANVQERLIALHHLDAPWRPADEVSVREEANGVAIIRRCRAVADVVQMDGELGGILRFALAQILARGDDFMPGFQGHRLSVFIWAATGRLSANDM
jgi:hypothetical protein